MRLPGALLILSLITASGCGTPTPAQDGGAGGSAGGGEGGGAGSSGGGGGSIKDAGTADAGFGPLAVGSFCDSKAWAICDRSRRCGAVSAGATFDNCLSDERGKCDQTGYAAGVSAGRLGYDAQKAADCLNGYAKGSCSQTPAACASIFTGKQPPDAGCLVAEECSAGSYCDVFALTCPYVCRPYQPVFELCDFNDADCEPQSTWCGRDGGHYQCFPRKADGDTCISTNYAECPRDSTCVYDEFDVGTCMKTYATTGEPCRVSGSYPVCDADSFCRQEGDPQDPPLPPGVCTKRIGLGGTCSGFDRVCQPGLRCSGLYTVGECVPLAREGDICNGYGDCELDLYCSTATSRCVRYPADGGDCRNTYYCDRGFYCDFTTYKCLPKREDGALCSDNYQACTSKCTTTRQSDAGYESRCAPTCAVRTDGGV
jgi:hypothetical protein